MERSKLALGEKGDGDPGRRVSKGVEGQEETI